MARRSPDDWNDADRPLPRVLADAARQLASGVPVPIAGVGELAIRADGRVVLRRQPRSFRSAFETGTPPARGTLARRLWDAVHDGPLAVPGVGTFRLGVRPGMVTFNPVDGSPIRVRPRLDLVLDGVDVAWGAP